jgi:choline dehydrogenase-like flavoprotein
VVLDSKSEPQVEYTLAEDDKKRFRRGVALAAKIMLKGSAKEVYLPTTENLVEGGAVGELHPVVITKAEQIDSIVEKMQFTSNQTIMSTAHLQATNKMGASAQNSVVGRDFHVWGTERLYVVDGSVFPTSIGANPMQSIYTFAKIFADRMNAARN